MDESNVIDERKAKLDAVEDECSYAYFDNEFFLGQDTLICYKDGSAIKSSSKRKMKTNLKKKNQPMSEYTVYSKRNCSYCVRAIELLESKGLTHDVKRLMKTKTCF